jgi:hypothetical protein
MAGARKSAEDRSNINKLYKPIAGYVGNVVKESKEFSSEFKKATRTPVTPKSYVAARGQLLGSLIGKRYDSKGNSK